MRVVMPQTDDPARIVAPRGERIAGYVLEHGRPVPGAKVVLTLRTELEWLDQFGADREKEATSDELGRFELGEIVPGAHVLVATRVERGERRALDVTLESSPLELEVCADEPLEDVVLELMLP